jgi:SAM-dependent methyltransferase/ribosomal protein S18 acetylase RimI-like enzyme
MAGTARSSPRRPKPLGIRRAESSREIATVRRLFREYEHAIGVDLGWQGFQEELRSLPSAYRGPRGVLLIGRVRGRIAGCVGLRPGPDGAGEIKRLFVRPAFRRSGLGRALVERVASWAREHQYDALVLDTLPEMAAAQRLYRSLGFRETAPYAHHRVPGMRYFRLDLARQGRLEDRGPRVPRLSRTSGDGPDLPMPPVTRANRRATSNHVRANRRFWEEASDEDDRRHTRSIEGEFAAAWGLWRIPESSLRLLGPVRGRSILELGCGAARWSIWLAGHGARPVGLDATRSQLEKARRLVTAGKGRVRLIQANAEHVPLRDASFDLVFCDWGAMTFCDPARTVPECARLLRPGGRLVFSTASPLRYVAFDHPRDRQTRRLAHSYFDLGRVSLGDTVEFQLPYGAWIDLFARSGLTVERLLEPRPGPDSRSSYVGRADRGWARDWPMEAIWSVRKRPVTALHRRGAE